MQGWQTGVAVVTLIGALSVAQAGGMTVNSSDMTPGAKLKMAQVYREDGCKGENISPSLRWSGEPAGTKSFAVTLFDPDAPTGGNGWWHWLVVNIPANVHELASGAGRQSGVGLPVGADMLTNDWGDTRYGGACPPPGNPPHRYILTVWALKTPHVMLTTATRGESAQRSLQAQALDQGSITAYYGR